jgi:ABC-type nitrate/sulfonate/bicarbonate transport system substrate-binding protein
MARDTPATARSWARAIPATALAVAVVVAAITAVAFVKPQWLPARPAHPGEPLTIAVSSTPHAALLHIAAAKGYFTEAGLDVTVKTVSHGKAALDQLASGEVDLAAAAEVPFVIAVLKGAPFSIAASVLSASDDMALVARRDRGIAAPRDLLGKKIGVTFGTSGEYFLWAFLIRHRLSPDAITWVDMAPPRMAQALASGAIDAASTWEPVHSAARDALAGNALSFAEGNAYTVTHVVIGHSEFMKSRSAAIEKLTRALLKAEAFNRADPRRAQSLIAARLKLDPGQLAAVWKGLAFRVDLRQSQLVTLEDEARWAMARGYAATGPIPNFLPHLHLDALLALEPERVTVVR